MADETDLDELARRYLDLWQDQMSALASDPEAAETMTRMITAAGAKASAAWAAWPAFMAGFEPASAARDGEASEKGPDGAAAGQAGESPRAAADRSVGGRPAPPGSAALAAASGNGGLDLDGLASRLAELEERVRALESGSRRRGGGASGKSRGGRS